MKRLGLFDSVCRGAFAIGAAGTFATAAYAQSSPTAEETVTVVAPSITTAPAVVPLTSPYSQSTITSDALRNISEQDSLQTMLSSQPSIFTYQNGPNGVGANIFFRAFNSGQFAETFDGIAINDVFNGGVTGEAATFNSVLFIPSNVDSVVLTRGINNPAVNSYNSLGGTINFLPKLPTAELGGTLASSYGSFNSYSVSGAFNTGSIFGYKQLLQLDYRQSDGWEQNTGNYNSNLYYSGLYDGPNGSQLSLVAVLNINRGHDPFEMPVPLLQQDHGFYQYPTTEADELGKDTESLVILDYKAPLAANIVFDNKFFVGGQNFLRTSYANPADSYSPYELPNQAETYDYWIYYPAGPTYNPKKTFGSDALGNDYHFYGYTNWAAGYTPTLTVNLPNNTITTGGNVTYGSLHSREYWYGSQPVPQTLGYNDAWDEHDTRILGSVYIQDEIAFLQKTLTITPGVKYEYAYTSDTDAIGFYYPYGGTVTDNEHFVAPTVGVNYKPTENYAFNFAFGQNIKFPDISAYYNDVPGTTAATPLTPPPVKIKPEHVNDFELGARYKNGGFAASLDLYREDFSSIFIDTFNQADYLTVVTNGGSARYQGVELQISDEVHLEHWGDLKGYFNAAYNDAEYTSKFTADSVGNTLSASSTTVTPGESIPDVPAVLLTAGGTWAYNGFRLDLEGRYVGSQYILNDETGVTAGVKIPGYFIMDASLSKTIILSNPSFLAKSVKFSIRADNLFNKYYYNQADIESSEPHYGNTEFASPGAPQSIIGKIEVAF